MARGSAQSHQKFRLFVLNLTYEPNERKKKIGRIRQEQPSSAAAPSTPPSMPRALCSIAAARPAARRGVDAMLEEG